MVKCVVKVILLHIDKKEVLSGLENGQEDILNPNSIIFHRGDVIEVTNEKFQALGSSVKRYLVPLPEIKDITQYTPEQIIALDKLDAKKADILKNPQNL